MLQEEDREDGRRRRRRRRGGGGGGRATILPIITETKCAEDDDDPLSANPSASTSNISSSCSTSIFMSMDEQNDGHGDGDREDFKCNICLNTARHAVVTLCGHLFCWPCLYTWLHFHSKLQQCPVCKGATNESNLIPIYNTTTTTITTTEDMIRTHGHSNHGHSDRRHIRAKLDHDHDPEPGHFRHSRRPASSDELHPHHRAARSVDDKHGDDEDSDVIIPPRPRARRDESAMETKRLSRGSPAPSAAAMAMAMAMAMASSTMAITSPSSPSPSSSSSSLSAYMNHAAHIAGADLSGNTSASPSSVSGQIEAISLRSNRNYSQIINGDGNHHHNHHQQQVLMMGRESRASWMERLRAMREERLAWPVAFVQGLTSRELMQQRRRRQALESSGGATNPSQSLLAEQNQHGMYRRPIQSAALVPANGGAIAHYLSTMSSILSSMEVFARALEVSTASAEFYHPWPSVVGSGAGSPSPSPSLQSRSSISHATRQSEGSSNSLADDYEPNPNQNAMDQENQYYSINPNQNAMDQQDQYYSNNPNQSAMDQEDQYYSSMMRGLLGKMERLMVQLQSIKPINMIRKQACCNNLVNPVSSHYYETINHLDIPRHQIIKNPSSSMISNSPRFSYRYPNNPLHDHYDRNSITGPLIVSPPSLPNNNNHTNITPYSNSPRHSTCEGMSSKLISSNSCKSRKRLDVRRQPELR